jgi:hypothetical protein
VSLKDDWGVEAMINRLSTKYKVRQACAILPNTAWGRSAEKVIQEKSGRRNAQFAVVRWYNWGDPSLKEHYKACLDLFNLNPSKESREFADLVNFVAQAWPALVFAQDVPVTSGSRRRMDLAFCHHCVCEATGPHTRAVGES